MGYLIADDYIDHDVAYLLGMLVARGTIIDRGDQGGRVVVEFPYQNLEVRVEDLQGDEQAFDVPTHISLGLMEISRRMERLLACRTDIVRTDTSRELVLDFATRTVGFRNILLQLNGRTSFRDMRIPAALRHPSVPTDVKLEFIRGFADVAGNIRSSNNWFNRLNRVRLDILNDNWRLPVEICNFIQLELGVPVQLITWGHPNMNRGFREHQLNIFAIPFLQIGFAFEHKQRVLELLAAQDRNEPYPYGGCPGRRGVRDKDKVEEENDDRLPDELRGKHFDAYWQICKALGCQIEPGLGPLFEDVEE